MTASMSEEAGAEDGEVGNGEGSRRGEEEDVGGQWKVNEPKMRTDVRRWGQEDEDDEEARGQRR